MSQEHRRQVDSEGAVGFRSDFISKVPKPDAILNELNQNVAHLFKKNGERPNIKHATAIQNFLFGIKIGAEMNQIDDAEYPDLVLYSDPSYSLASQADVGIILNVALLVEQLKGNGNWIEEKKGGQFIYKGNIDNYFILAGVEEASHVKYEEQDPMGAGLHPKTTSLAEYDAQPHEYIALQQKLEVAERLMMHADTIDVIRLRIENARQSSSK